MRQDQNDDCGDIHLAANTSIFGECDLISPADRKHFVFDNMNWFGATKVDRKGEVERPGKKIEGQKWCARNATQNIASDILLINRIDRRLNYKIFAYHLICLAKSDQIQTIILILTYASLASTI